MQEYLIPHYMNEKDIWVHDQMFIYNSYPGSQQILEGEVPTTEQVLKLRERDSNGKKLYYTARRFWDPDKQKWLVKDIKEYRTDERRCGRDYKDMRNELRQRFREQGIDPDSVR